MFFFQICEVGWLTTNYECLYARVAFFGGGQVDPIGCIEKKFSRCGYHNLCMFII
jgi:hypothetical protein